MINKLLMLALIFIMPGCAKQAVKQLEYDMLIATDNQTNIAIEEMEQDKNIIKSVKESNEDTYKPPIVYSPGFVTKLQPPATNKTS